MRTTIAWSFLLLVLAAGSSFGQGARPYRSLAVMDLQVEGVSPRETGEIVDYLSQRIRETNAVRRVLERGQREKRLAARPAPERTGDYQQGELERAARLGVQAAVLGSLAWNRQQYVLRLRLVDVKSRKTLFEEAAAFRDKGELLAGCERMALRLAAAAALRPAAPGEVAPGSPPPEVAWGLSLGQQGVSESSAVVGGSYLYAQGSLLVDEAVGLSLRYALRLFPTAGGDQLLGVNARFQVPLTREFFLPLELGYLLDLRAHGELSHLVGGRIALLAGGDEEFIIELLPVGLYVDVDTGEAVFTLELLSFTLFLGK